MENHHKEAIDIFLSRYKDDPSILAILLGGSIAHGFAKPNADIDVLLVVSEAEYERRKKENQLAFSIWDICNYDGGYVDCKAVSIAFMQLIAEKGSDPARYAFKDAVILHNKVDELASLLEKVTTYPKDQIAERRHRFASQLLAWKWYYSEAVKKENHYLIHLAISKFTLFACRLILNENQRLYPYHKWMLAETKRAAAKPAGFDDRLDHILKEPNWELIQTFTNDLLAFLHLEEKNIDWPSQFLLDSEWNWLEHEPPVDDL